LLLIAIDPERVSRRHRENPVVHVQGGVGRGLAALEFAGAVQEGDHGFAVRGADRGLAGQPGAATTLVALGLDCRLQPCFLAYAQK